MLALIWSAIRARRVSTLVLFALAALTAAALGFAPWYVQHAQRDAATARIAATPPSQRTLSAEVVVSLERDPAEVLRRFERSADTAAGLSVERRTVGVRVGGTLGRTPQDLAYREDLCANLVVEGRCPQQRGEIVLTGQTAAQLGARIGDELSFSVGPAAVDVPLRLVGLYTPREPLAWYWSGTTGSAAYTTARGSKSGRIACSPSHRLIASGCFWRYGPQIRPVGRRWPRW